MSVPRLRLAIAVAVAACDRSPESPEDVPDPEPPHTGVAETGAPPTAPPDPTGPVDPPVHTGTPDPTTEPLPPPLPACPAFDAPVRVGTTPLFVLDEASGLAASRRNPDVLWSHNDSGSGPELHAFTPRLTGGQLGTFRLDGADATDWEDLAVGPGPDPALTYVYVGDIGDNGRDRDTVQVYRVAEPAVAAGGGAFQGGRISAVERFELQYPNGPRDAEALMVDPVQGDVYVVVKDGSGATPVYRAAAPLVAGAPNAMTEVAVLSFGVAPLAGDTLVTAADITADGSEIAIRTYDAAFAWRRVAGASIADALATDPCPIPQAAEGQGEAFGYWQDGQGYFTVGEGSATWVNSYSRQ